jgi:hypothetical protein
MIYTEFVRRKPYQSSLMCTGKTRVDTFQFFPLLTNIKLGWRGLSGMNTLGSDENYAA